MHWKWWVMESITGIKKSLGRDNTATFKIKKVLSKPRAENSNYFLVVSFLHLLNMKWYLEVQTKSSGNHLAVDRACDSGFYTEYMHLRLNEDKADLENLSWTLQ